MPSDFVKLLIALVGPAQGIEDAFQQLLTERGINDSIGAQLDQVGALVGQPRNGLADEDYRRYCRAKILTNKSCGELERLIKISRLILDLPAARILVHYEDYATVIVRIADVAISGDLADILIGFLRKAKAGGVRLVLEWSESLPEDTFRFDSGPGFDVGHLAGGTS